MFSGIEKGIVIAQRFFQRSGLLTWVAGNNAVHQRGAEGIRCFHPIGKRRRKLPGLRILQYQGFKRLTVIVDKLTRNNYPTFIHRTSKVVKTLQQQTRQFGWKADRWRIINLVGCVIANPGFGGI